MSLTSHRYFGWITVRARPDGFSFGQVSALALVAVACVSTAILLYFHNRFWWPPDDGAYAHVASRILGGEVLNFEVQDIHLGYINFANAIWLWLFGADLVSQRYPLAVMTVVQACLIFRLILPWGLPMALTGAFAMSTLSFVQFLNPTAHWYALFVFVLIVWVLARPRLDTRWRLELLGYLIITLVLFRQLSGALVAIGALAYLFAETPERRDTGNPWLARVLILVMAALLAAYLCLKTDIVALLLFAVGPLGALIWAARVTEWGGGGTLRLIVRLTLGGVLALAPLAAYHAWHGSLATWLDDTVWSALHLTALDFMGKPSYMTMVFLGARQLFPPENLGVFLNGLFWIVLPLVPLGIGVALASGLFRAGRKSAAFHPLPFLAAFYALVSTHYQIPVYLFYSTAITLCALLVLCADGIAWRRHAAVGVVVALSATGLWYQAGQPLSRSLAEIAAGERVPYVRAQGIARASLWMTVEDARQYRALIDLVERETPAEGAILALPFNPELNFLTGRRNPVRFFNAGFGLPDEDAFRDAVEAMRRDPPGLVFHRPDDKYNTSYSARLLDYVRARYEPLPSQGGFDIYRYRPRTEFHNPRGGTAP